MTIVERITHIRKEQHITQEEMAKKLNIKQGSLSDIERGKVNVVTDFNRAKFLSFFEESIGPDYLKGR